MNNAMHRPLLASAKALCAALLLVVTLPAWAATRPFNAQKPADPAGTVEVVNVEGAIEITGWDQPMVEVSGTIGEKVDRVDVTGSANHTTVRVVLPPSSRYGGDSSANLKIRVPQKSALEVSLVSADLRVAGVSGDQHLQTVSGDINGDAGGALQISTVSGDIRLSTRNSHDTQIKSVSGDVSLSGADGNVQLNT